MPIGMRGGSHALLRSCTLLWVIFSMAVEAEPRADVADYELAARIDQHLQPYLEAGHLSGTFLVAQDGRVRYQRSFGLAQREHGVPVAPDTRFGIGSVNKPMTIVILARLLEAEKLALDEPLTRFLPEFPRAADITVGDLLNHRSGIPHRVTGRLDETRPQTPASMTELAARKPLVFEPGSDSVYSSAGFSLLARVLELASGSSYADLLEQYLLHPAGMRDTSDAGTRAVLPGRADSYYFDTGGLANAPPYDISYLVGAGSVFSTPADLLAMQRALLEGTLGERAREFLVHENGGLEWNGVAHGYRAFADYDAATGVSIVAASNLVSGALDRIRTALPKIVAGEQVPVPGPVRAQAANIAAREFESYQGAYQLRPGRNLELRIVDGRVRMEEWLLIPTGERTFFSPQDYAEIKVVVDERGEAVRLDWKIGDQTYPLPRVEERATSELESERKAGNADK